MATKEIVDGVTRAHRRMSPNLNDTVGQDLYVLRLMVTQLASSLRTKGSEAGDLAEAFANHVALAQQQRPSAIKNVYPKKTISILRIQGHISHGWSNPASYPRRRIKRSGIPPQDGALQTCH